MLEIKEAYVSIREYLENTPGAVLLFVLRDTRGQELNRQVVDYDHLSMKDTNTFSAPFVVDELLTAKMVPGIYSLFIYLSLPKSEGSEEPTPADYNLDKCLTDAGIKIVVQGGAQGPSVGVGDGKN